MSIQSLPPGLGSDRIDIKDGETALFPDPGAQKTHAASVKIDLLQLDLLAAKRHLELVKCCDLGHVFAKPKGPRRIGATTPSPGEGLLAQFPYFTSIAGTGNTV